VVTRLGFGGAGQGGRFGGWFRIIEGRDVLAAGGNVADFGDLAAAFAVPGGVVGDGGGEAIDIAVVHAEGGGDEDGVVDFEVGGAFAAGRGDIAGGDAAPAFLDFSGDDEESFELGRNAGFVGSALDAVNESFVAAEMSRGDGAVDGLAVVAVVLRGDVGGDEFASTRRERAWAAKEDFDELVHGSSGLRAKGEEAANAGQVVRDGNVGHGDPPGEMLSGRMRIVQTGEAAQREAKNDFSFKKRTYLINDWHSI